MYVGSRSRQMGHKKKDCPCKKAVHGLFTYAFLRSYMAFSESDSFLVERYDFLIKRVVNLPCFSCGDHQGIM